MQNWEYIKLFITLLVISVIMISVMTFVKRVKRKARDVSNLLFGHPDLIKGINKQADVLAETPKSVSAMTAIMEPQIVKDFPEFVWDEFKHKAENMLESALLAITNENVSMLVDASEDVKKQVQNQIFDNERNAIKEVYSDIHIYQTEISDYRKEHGKCMIVIQSAVGHLHYKEKNNKIIEGSKERKTQTKYNIELVYIQDQDVLSGENAVGTTCPNCGAPIKNLGAKYCEYCGTGIIPINIKVWSLHKFYEVDYNRA